MKTMGNHRRCRNGMISIPIVKSTYGDFPMYSLTRRNRAGPRIVVSPWHIRSYIKKKCKIKYIGLFRYVYTSMSHAIKTENPVT
jgi:hypothetical protein